ncbi:uncharacterized protein si:ch73-103b9.2 [Heterodontus francisci]|uniref:uncharacterized protein si:ch73-103b9.2 n=1 Tax=Heterodontus francisci TaxID=7792 RepID=UPI00355B18E8
MNEQINNLSLLDENVSWKMEFQNEVMVDCEKITFSNPLGGDSNVTSPTHFLHSWESERKLIDVLIRLSEETYEEDQKQMDQFILCSGWDDAVHGWRRGNSYSSVNTLKKSKKSRKEERNDSRCVLCAEMVPISERKAFQEVEYSNPSSKLSNSTMAYNFTGKNTNSSAERTPPPVSQTKLQQYSFTVSQRQTSEATQEIQVQDKTETDVNPSHETVGETIHGPDQQTPVKKNFSVLPPVKMANGDETSVSGFRTGRTFCLDIQNGNRDLQTVSVMSKRNNNKANMHIRAHACNMAMFQVSKIQKAGTSAPVGFTRMPFQHTMNHWCWQYSLMQGNHNLAINGTPASKLVECHSVRVQPSKVTKCQTKNIKQDDFSKSAFSHNGPSSKHLGRIRQRNVAGRDILPMIPQPDPPPSSGTRIAISILPHKLL